MRTATLFVALISFATWAPAEDNLPPAPPGFSWKQFEKTKALLLVPEGWFVKEQSAKGTDAIFITKENIDEDGRYSTGLSVNVVQKLKDKKAVEVAQSHIAKLQEQNKGERSWKTNAGKLKGYGCQIKADKGGPLRMSCLALANTETNTLYLVVFEAPEADWDTAWKKGAEMMKKLGFDDEV